MENNNEFLDNEFVDSEVSATKPTKDKKKKKKKKKVKKKKLSKADKRALKETEQLAAIDAEIESELKKESEHIAELKSQKDFTDVGFLNADNTYDIPFAKKSNLELELPNKITRQNDSVIVGNKYAKILTISDTDERVSDINFDPWANLLPRNAEGYMSMSVRPVTKSQRRKELDDELRNLNAELYNEKLNYSERKDIEAEIKNKNAELDKLGTRGYVTQNAAVFFESSADLANNKRKEIVQDFKDEYAITMKEPFFNTLEELTTNSAFGPRLGIDEYMRETSVDELKVRFPFKNQLQVQPNGVNMGTDAKGFPVFSNYLSIDNAKKGNDNRNLAILADSGNGKTYTTSALMMNSIFQGHTFCIIDSEGEFVKISERLGGKSIKFDAASNIQMNLFDLGDSFEDEIEIDGKKVWKEVTGLTLKKERLTASLVDFAELLKNGEPLTATQRTLITHILDDLYDAYQFTDEPESLYYNGKLKPMPQFGDFYIALTNKGDKYLEIKHSMENSFEADKYEERLYAEEGFSISDYLVLKNIFKEFTVSENGAYKIFDCATPTDFSLNNWEDLPVINFDISKIIEQNGAGKKADVKSVLLLTTLLEWIQIGFLNTHPEISKALVVDEFFRFTSDLQPLAKYTAGFFAGQARTIRKRNAFLWLITQNVHELNNDAGKEIITQTKHLITLGFADKESNYNGLRNVAGYTDNEISTIFEINRLNSRDVKNDDQRSLKGHYLYKSPGGVSSKKLHLVTSDYQHKEIMKSAKGGH